MKYRLRKFAGNRNLSTTLRIFFFLIVIIPIALISTVVLQVYKNDLLQQATDRSQQTMQAFAYSTQQEIARMVGIFATIGMDQHVLEYSTAIQGALPTDRHSYSNDLVQLLDSYTSSVSGYVLSINFFYKNGGSYSYLGNLNEDEAALRSSAWYRSSMKQKDHVHFLGMEPNPLYSRMSSPHVMAAALAPSDFHVLHNVEMIYFVFDGTSFENILRKKYDSSSAFYIVGEDGKVIASNSFLKQGSPLYPELFDKVRGSKQGHFIDKIGGEKKLVAYASVEGTNWKVIHESSYGEVMANYETIFKLILVAAVAIIFAFLAISLYLVSNVTRPIHRLVRQMSRVMGGDLDAKIQTSGSRETVKLGETFNHMMDQIGLLIVEREEQEKAKSKAEFAALQSQINPHFLINTLNSIKLMALISNADNIRNMTHALTRLLSSSFNRGGSLTKLSDEIENLRHYLYIMEIRYGNKLTVEWDINDEVQSFYILKLLLQPILENCIVHGLHNKENGGTIRIAAKVSAGDLLFGVADDGVGMPEQLLAEYDAGGQDRTFSGMGIGNVHRRIQLHYGNHYGLRIENNEPSGTIVWIKLPILRQGDEEEAV